MAEEETVNIDGSWSKKMQNTSRKSPLLFFKSVIYSIISILFLFQPKFTTCFFIDLFRSQSQMGGRERGVKPWVVTGPPPVGLLRVKAGHV